MTSVDLSDLIKRFRAQRPFVRWFTYALLLALVLKGIVAMTEFSAGFSRGFTDSISGTKYSP